MFHCAREGAEAEVVPPADQVVAIAAVTIVEGVDIAVQEVDIRFGVGDQLMKQLIMEHCLTIGQMKKVDQAGNG